MKTDASWKKQKSSVLKPSVSELHHGLQTLLSGCIRLSTSYCVKQQFNYFHFFEIYLAKLNVWAKTNLKIIILIFKGPRYISNQATSVFFTSCNLPYLNRSPHKVYKINESRICFNPFAYFISRTIQNARHINCFSQMILFHGETHFRPSRPFRAQVRNARSLASTLPEVYTAWCLCRQLDYYTFFIKI